MSSIRFLTVAVLYGICGDMYGQAGPDARQVVDSASAARGKTVYIQYCINCHGSLAQGAEDGPDLIRSSVVLHDNLGSEIGPTLQKTAIHKTSLTPAQTVDISHFLKQRIEETVKNRNAKQPPNVLTGNANAGKTYFNGAGKCNTCHSPAGDLAGVGKRYDSITLQQRFLFPRNGSRNGVSPTQVTVTPPSGPAVTGTLDRIDDFNVSLRDASGEYHSWQRTAGLQVDLRNPYAAHNELLDQYTDTDMHNIVAYLATLK